MESRRFAFLLCASALMLCTDIVSFCTAAHIFVDPEDDGISPEDSDSGEPPRMYVSGEDDEPAPNNHYHQSYPLDEGSAMPTEQELDENAYGSDDGTPVEFICHNGQRIPDALACDGYPHCIDGSDELPNMCLQKPCESKDWTMCKSSGRCIKRSMLCDDIDDCEDGSDEDAYVCKGIDKMPDRVLFGVGQNFGPKNPLDDPYSIEQYLT